MATEKPAAPPTDWEGIEREYRAGQLSEAAIARQFGVSRAAIQKRAKKNNWSRDLTEKVRLEVAARLVAEGLQPQREAATVEQAATRGVQLVLGHRSGLARLRTIAEKLAGQLEADSDDIKEIEAAIEEETAGDKSGERRARMLKAVSLGSRAGIAQQLSQVLKNLIPLERQAFNLDDKSGSDPDVPASGTVVHKLDPASAELLKRLVE
jgi:hypothetical protein